MENRDVVGQMNEFLHLAASLLSEWLGHNLPKVTEHWWNECVLDILTSNQREIAKETHITGLEEFDLAALVRIADQNWYSMEEYVYLTSRDREVIREIRQVRNHWSHCDSSLPGKDTIIRDIEILRRFLAQFSAPNDVLRQLEDFEQEVKNHYFPFRTVTEAENQGYCSASMSDENIVEKSRVYLVGDPSAVGMVFSVEDMGDIKKYQVFIDGVIKVFYSGQIALVEDTPKYHWIDAETLESYLTAYQINNPSSCNLYSLNAARIDFVPYQFRPALKLIQSDEPRILIADSVGVGKTIEAGLIIKELEARNELENIMVICPKPLVTERKWEDEMKKFDEEFLPLDGKQLRMLLSDTDRDGEWPARFGRTIVPYSILDSRTYEGNGDTDFGLVHLDPAPHFDLVIVDEAHHIRNGSMEKEKAYAYKCVKYFCDHADAVVMLTATPLQTSDDDLFTLLNILRPDIVLDQDTFKMMSRPNAGISRASRIVRGCGEHWQERALEALTEVTKTQWGENVIAQNPVYGDILGRLQQNQITREERVQLITDIESLHSFNTMLNRTRRRDIQDFCIRRNHTVETEFTVEQKKLHDELLNFERAALARQHEIRSIPFMMSTIRRQAASCIYGLAPFMNDLIHHRFDQMADDPEVDLEEEKLYARASDSLTGMAKRLLELASNLPEKDPKIESVLDVVRQKQKQENNKIILFSTFRHTLAYVRRKLEQQKIRVAQIDGSTKDEVRVALRKRFALPKENSNALDMLLFTEVGSEGLDYQFCNTMINYDLPWNPMRIEQRIGRIDRRGQQSDVVNIYNVLTAGTVDADIYNRCLLRIGIFEKSIGECDEILQTIGAEVEKIALDSQLTDKERKQKLEQMADNEVRKMQELSKFEDEEKELFGFDRSGFTTAKEIQEAESPWLSQRSLETLIERYLTERLGKGCYIIGESALKTLRLSKSARQMMREDLNKLPDSRSSVRRNWEVYLKGNEQNHKLTFDAGEAEQNRDRDVFFITTVHPLVRQAAAYFATETQSYVNLQISSDTVQTGDYPFSVYAWNYMGIHPHFKLVPVCMNQEISRDLTDYLSTARTVPFEGNLSENMWKEIEEKQISMWRREKTQYVQEMETTVNYKLESLEYNFRNRCRMLEQKMEDTIDFTGKMKRMYQSQIDRATEQYEFKRKEILKAKADIHITLIVNGIIHVKGV